MTALPIMKTIIPSASVSVKILYLKTLNFRIGFSNFICRVMNEVKVTAPTASEIRTSLLKKLALPATLKP